MTKTGSGTNDHLERHYDRGAWLTLLAAVVLLLWPLVQVAIALGYPVDGWDSVALVDGASRSGPFRLDFPINNLPSTLQADDIVTAIDGRELVEGQLPPLTPPWIAGQTVSYTVLRNGGVLDADVVLADADVTTFLTQLTRLPWTFSVAALVWFLMGAMVFYLRPQQAATRFLLIAGTFLLGTTIMDFVESGITYYSQPPLAIYLASVYQSGWVWLFATSTLLFVLAFPVLLWPMKRYPRLVPLLVYGLTLGAILFVAPRYPNFILSPIQDLVGGLTTIGMFTAVLIAILYSVFYNLRRSNDPVTRAQFRWLAFGLILGLSPIFLPSVVLGTVWTSDTALDLVDPVQRVGALISLALPLALAIGILRYRLFDIDVIIRRTTSYAILTGILLLVYLGSIIVLQQVLSPITGESDAAIVLSTLLIAALFLPLRRRVQSVIDRRFFRSKYDAEQVLASFAATVRDETDLDELTAELVRVIQDTMQPEFVSIWLKPTPGIQSAATITSE